MPHSKTEKIERVLFTEAQIGQIVSSLARRIDEDYGALIRGYDDQLVLLGVLKSAVHFLSDLSRRVQIPHRIDTISARSYYGAKPSPGPVEITRTPEIDLAGKHVLLVEDIYDTGRTLARVLELIRSTRPKSIAVCVLLSKPTAHLIPVDIKYLGVDIPDQFVVGYGLDYDERYRDLPFIGLLKMNEKR